MDIKSIISALHPLEREVLPLLAKYSSFTDICKHTKLSEVEVMRALQWLANKKIVDLVIKTKEFVKLGANGEKYSRAGLPERRVLSALEDGEKTLKEAVKKANLGLGEINVCIGLLRGVAQFVAIGKEPGLKIIYTDIKKRKEDLAVKENFLKKQFPIEVKKLRIPDEQYVFEELKKRKEILEIYKEKTKTAVLTALGKELASSKIDAGNIIDSVTTEMLKTSAWKGKDFRAYDIEINVPKIYAGKRHFANDAIRYVKQIWLDLGFKEMTGSLIQTSFWNFDALFTAQDHPSRDLQDTFFIKEPKYGKLPDKKLVDYVKKAHENGADTNSLGWRYQWDEKTAMENVLRTHTTALSARAIAALKRTEIPAKFFSVSRCFRNEALDWSHLFEFDQVEGIVVGEDANFRNLLAYLQEFYKKMGYDTIRIRPAYFPYTEPSLEVDVFDRNHNKWIELGGAGIFRPEVVKPLLGKDVPVLAWGLGLARIISLYYGIKDIRDLYKNDLKQIREMKAWLR